MRPNYLMSVEEGVRNLCLGRVLLKRDLSAGSKQIPVGMLFDDTLGCVGSQLFYNNPLDTSGTAILVQPAASNKPGAIEYQETITIDQDKQSTKHHDIYAEEAVVHNYTMARGAYLRLATLPSVCGSLKMIEEDFLAVGVEPADKWFPGILVISLGSRRQPDTNVHYIDTETIVVRYAEAMVGGVGSAHTKDSLEALEDLISEDPNLGGTCQWADLIGPGELCPTPGRIASQNRIIATATGNRICWGDIRIQAHRYRVVDKKPHPNLVE